MGTDYYPRTIIGVRLPWTKLFKKEWYKERVPYTQLPARHKERCDSELHDTATFCPSCGCRLEREHMRIVALTPEVTYDNDEGDIEFHDWDVSRAGEPDDYADIFIGFDFVEGEEHGVLLQIDVTAFDKKKARLKADLEEIGLWDDDSFGLWSFMFISC